MINNSITEEQAEGMAIHGDVVLLLNNMIDAINVLSAKVDELEKLNKPT